MLGTSGKGGLFECSWLRFCQFHSNELYKQSTLTHAESLRHLANPEPVEQLREHPSFGYPEQALSMLEVRSPSQVMWTIL